MLKKLLKALLSSHAVHTVKQQMEYIDALEDKYKDFEKDALLRTFLQYKCIFSDVSIFSKLLLNILAFFSIPFVLLIYFVKGLSHKSRDEKNKKEVVFIDANNKYGMSYDYSDRFPYEEVNVRFGEVFFYKIVKYPDVLGGSLNLWSLKKWIKLVIRYPYLPYLNFTCLLYLGLVNNIVNQFHPSAIINAKVETNYTSSFITWCCESRKINYELIMHGDLFLNKSMAFNKFSTIYIWDKYYKDMFTRLYVKADAFIVFTPQIFRPLINENVCPKVYATYYLSGTGDGDYIENVSMIVQILNKLGTKGLKVHVRPHPRWSNVDELRKMCKRLNVEIEDYESMSVEASLANTKYVIGSFSTVLLQAYFANKDVIIDDLTNKKGYDECVEANYILLSKKHLLLSDFLKDLCDVE